MKYNKILALVPALLLAACGGGDQVVQEKTTPGSVVYSYPADGQIGISPKADIILRFSDAITENEGDLQSKIKLVSDGSDRPFTVTKVDGGKSLKLETDDNLAPAASYSITFSEPLQAEGNRAIGIPDSVGEDGIQFSTRASFSGIAELAKTADSFAVSWQVPAADSNNANDTDTHFKAMNFSTFRLAMTQPVHPDWKELGGSIELVDKDGQPVPATVLVKGNRITVDPCVTDDPQLCGSKDDILNSGETYTLKLTDLTSLVAASDAPRFTQELSYTPRDTGPTVVLKQSAADSGLAAGKTEKDSIHSILNGQPINGVTLNSVLQGVAGPSQQTGDLFAELAFAPAFETDEALPLRIAKGSILRSTSLDVLVGGIVPITEAVRPGEPTGALQTTGDIKVTMLSDASGYMSPNAYTDDISAPRQITLFMDVSMNTGEAQPNAALSQDLMAVELRGIALVRDGVLTIDAIGMVEPNLLGQEYTDSTIAFHLEAATDAGSALDAEQERLLGLDSTGPELVSWMPGAADAIPATRQSMQRPGDPVILFFDEPLDPASVKDGVTLYEDGQPVANLHSKLDGTALTLNPEGGLKQGVAYKVSAPGLTDLAGNVATTADLSFRLNRIDTTAPSVPQSPPLALTTYPGFPCETTEDDIDLAAGTHGQCWDASDPKEVQVGDVLPLSEMPADRPITVVFSQQMKLDSIRPETFIVEKVSVDKTSIETVPGRLEKNNQRVRFFPDEPWEHGAFYRYTMKVDRQVADCANDTPTSICGANNLQLKTDLLEGLNDGGNTDNSMIIYFKGVAAQGSVFTALRNLPIRDINANFRIDCDSNDDGADCLEPFDHEGSDSEGYQPSANAAKLLVASEGSTFPSRVGCETDGPDCPRDKFIYQTYALNTEVTGAVTDPVTGETGVGILLYPTLLATTSADVFIGVPVLGQQTSTTNTQVLRMRYAKTDPNCTNSCERAKLIQGMIVEGDNGEPIFKATVDLSLDAPDLEAPLGATHNLYNYGFTLELEGPVTFFDDGRMQVEQRNINVPEINVTARALGVLDITIPLIIPKQGIYLNFISNPVKEIPAVQ